MAKYKSLTHKELPMFMWMNEKLLYYAAAKKMGEMKLNFTTIHIYEKTREIQS